LRLPTTCVSLLGPTGIGKSWLGCALAQKACRDGFSVLHKRTSELFRELAVAHADGLGEVHEKSLLYSRALPGARSKETYSSSRPCEVACSGEESKSSFPCPARSGTRRHRPSASGRHDDPDRRDLLVGGRAPVQ
jgi:IstB-like ATP binding protein